MKFSVVTISYNQAQFLERAFLSVLAQTDVEIEYIVVDPGSTDNSRQIIERYRDRISHSIFERDKGPADGLNKGFAHATGDIFCYLNSSDEFRPNTFSRVARFFASHTTTDVICGHAWIVDKAGNRLRRSWSNPYSRVLVAYGAAIQIQPSTFIRAERFRRTKGFNIQNHSCWDAELLLDLALSGARIDIIDEFLSHYRLHGPSVSDASPHAIAQERILFEKLMGRPWAQYDQYIASLTFLVRQVRNPRSFFERLRCGNVKYLTRKAGR
jgi:glycosyltransferase involved in cell wall biosynthesis